jgi:hypothetical protein
MIHITRIVDLLINGQHKFIVQHSGSVRYKDSLVHRPTLDVGRRLVVVGVLLVISLVLFILWPFE